MENIKIKYPDDPEIQERYEEGFRWQYQLQKIAEHKRLSDAAYYAGVWDAKTLDERLAVYLGVGFPLTILVAIVLFACYNIFF